MQTAIRMPVLAFLTLAVQSGVAGDWESLGRVPKNRSVKVQLESGKKLSGTIQQVGPESLQIVLERGRTQVRIKDLTRTVDATQVGKPVELTTRSGQMLQGTLQEVDGERLWLAESRNAIQISRTEIRRVSFRSHWMGALAGLGIGAGGGAAYGAATANPSKGKAQGVGANAAEGAGIFGLMGAAAGAIIGIPRTIYESASSNATGHR